MLGQFYWPGHFGRPEDKTLVLVAILNIVIHTYVTGDRKNCFT